MLAAWLLAPAPPAWAQRLPQGAAPTLGLKPTPSLVPNWSAAARAQAPTFLYADRLSGEAAGEVQLEGRAELRRAGTVIRADRLRFNPNSQQMVADGSVSVHQAGNVFQGQRLDMQVDDFTGTFTGVDYSLLRYGARGQAQQVDFVSPQRATVRHATYTTCPCTPGMGLPAWLLKAGALEIDEENDTGTARDAVFTFKGVSTPALPDISFALGDKRRSGWLPPTLGLDTASGLTYAQPYYWDIAPNRDATVTPTLMSSRGFKVDNEFRYLEPDYRGTARLDLMPADTLRRRLRWGAALNHVATIQTGWSAMTGLALSANLNRVSDADYWRDFPRSSGALAQRLLPNDVNLSWADESLSWLARVQRWQTLQSAGSVIVPPYDRWPQVLTRYQRPGWMGIDVALEGELTQFVAERTLTLQPNAWRSYGQARLSKPWRTPGGSITPTLQLHATQYRFDAPLTDGRRYAGRLVPTGSMDAHLVFERPVTLWGRNLTQTLEPRAVYAYTPYRDQRALPLYDTGVADFNFATIFSPNPFIGHDRLADNNLLTLGATSRFIDNGNGGELIRLAFAQRLRFQDQRVTLKPTDPVVDDRVSDQLLGLGINWNPQWAFESTWQYNLKDEVSKRGTMAVRYHPSAYRTVSLAYRMQRDVSEQLDLGWQWPINDLWGDRGRDLGRGQGQGEGRWYSVGRLNYSLREHRMIDALLGLEYDAGCWLGRVVVSRMQTGAAASGTTGAVLTSLPTSTATSISFQLEFVGLSRVGVGASPLRLFKQNVPRFEYLREPQPAPNPLSHYD